MEACNVHDLKKTKSIDYFKLFSKAIDKFQNIATYVFIQNKFATGGLSGIWAETAV